jgi:small subunit ribosomal protein S6
MPYYETVFITRQDASSAQVEQLAETFTGIITANGGSVTKKEQWGLRNLSFRIKKNRKGHYTLFNIDAPAPAIVEMERNMRINEDVLRYLTVRVEALEEGPSAMLQNRNRDGDDRGGRGGRGGDRFGDRPRRSFGDRGGGFGGDRGDRGGDRGERGGDRGERGGDRGERGDRFGGGDREPRHAAGNEGEQA